ncbi:unnamed protein product [Linum tenue]|uniref:non-specific serine/threonine protein kinase n=1 Tax=Linum tenue TaxID=586396 RepID=A0AAV0P859_9ROSI|nr:unnamed protein product [Linum tenue]
MKYRTCLPFSILLIALLLKPSPALSEEARPPNPPPQAESLIISCGATEPETGEDGRSWQPDDRYLTSTSGGEPKAETAAFQDPALGSAVPFMSARIFESRGGYKFAVPTNTRVMIRFYFYASTYGTFDAADSYFALTVNDYQLLNNFSAAIASEALTQAYIMKEFSLLPSPSGVLNVVFTPSAGYKGAFAFVNGVEVIPMPDIFDDSPPLVGIGDQTVDLTAYGLQSMYRLNVGGEVIPPANDSAGLRRTWYNDFPYLFGGADGRTVYKKDVKYPTDEVPEPVAPRSVYTTSRSMSEDPMVNQKFNLTWVFQVDANFTYMVRLHFCDGEMTRANQRAFHIYLNNQTAQETADVIAWTGGKGIPIYKDYALYQNDKSGGNLWLALHPNTASHPEFVDAILNGVEVFKLNSVSKRSFAAPNPELSEMMSRVEDARAASSFESEGGGQVVGAIAGGATGLAVVVVVSAVVLHKKRRTAGKSSRRSGSSSNWLPLYGNSHTSSRSTGSRRSTNSSHMSTVAQGLCRHFSLQEIKHATRNFDEAKVIGVGGFGKVYKGVIDGTMEVAIKRSNPQSEQGVNEFETEIEMLSKLRHKHLVSLIGFCDEDDEMALVYDFMANGTLREHLYKGNKQPLPWKQRLEICIGSARGLHYLHTGAKYTIIHRDVKTTNILLDGKWVAKVSDFGLSKTGPDLNAQAHVSTVVKGSFGYLDPEYFRRQQLTEKSDVYSFGVVLFEVLCARPALNPSLSKEQVSLADWALQCQRKGNLEDIIDPLLKGDINPECLKKFAETAEKCLADAGVHRPSMGDVLWNLEFALQLQENPKAAAAAAIGQKGGEIGGGNGGGRRRGLSTVDEEVSVLTSDDTDDSEIFSQIVNPKGR